ncbi:Hypothetical protein, putative [Bodo saltans]|uniref:Uncharacterized protein n=1 Tax=Bodo saltans TaxID=75058 RepID=A0A0S4JRZ2_BODSA|nr:Hypothetical protein, putative [Bodo saltans]|eukprot:CUG92970.1 Hypothetical protein, putative [Bodo saltans]
MSIRSSDSEVMGTTTIELKDIVDVELQRTHIAYYPEDLGRYSISPAMMVMLSTLMTGVFEENFSNIGDGPERNIAKFLYLAVQVFYGRPVRELVDFIAGPSAIVGKAAQKILDDNTTIDFQSLTLRICGDVPHFRGAELSSVPSKAPVAAHARTSIKVARRGLLSVDDTCVCKVSRKARGQRVGTCTSCAWIECSPSWLPSADVVFHIPKVITITIQLSEGSDITELGHGSKAGSAGSKQYFLTELTF